MAGIGKKPGKKRRVERPPRGPPKRPPKGGPSEQDVLFAVSLCCTPLRLRVARALVAKGEVHGADLVAFGSISSVASLRAMLSMLVRARLVERTQSVGRGNPAVYRATPSLADLLAHCEAAGAVAQRARVAA